VNATMIVHGCINGCKNAISMCMLQIHKSHSYTKKITFLNYCTSIVSILIADLHHLLLMPSGTQ
jgi:hypothetical protein